MKTSIATVCLSGTLKNKFKAAAVAGFNGVEIFEQDLIVAPESPEEISAYAQELGLTLDLYQPLRDIEGVDEATFARNLHRAEEKFKLMRRMGIDLILVCSNVATASYDDDALAAKQLGQLADLASAYHIKVAYEALAWGKFVNTYQRSWKIVQEANRKNLGVCLDSFHILSRGSSLDDISTIPGDKIFFLQLADAPAMSLDILEWSRHHRLFPGEGNFDLTAFLAAVLSAGYAGPLSLEVFNDTFRQTNLYRTALDAHRSLTWLIDETHHQNPSTSRRWAPLPRPELPQSIGWAEIRGQETDQIQQTLTHLGFHKVGEHHTKPVQLWAQGEVRIIINEDHLTEEEPNLASLAFRVPHQDSAVARCQALKFPQEARISTPTDQQFTVFLAPDQTEIFFLPLNAEEDHWVKEFTRNTGATPTEPPLITNIDHINLVQPKQYYPESTLFFRAALGLTLDDATSLPAPDGLVSSQVAQNPNQTVRLPLNIAPELRTTGSSEHLAFTCTDIMALSRRAQAAGLAVLPIPANYYEDLTARYGLPKHFIDQIRELNLLYDQDEQGEFLHFYTQTSGRIFFEVVERRAGYTGFGVANAPVRMASQHRMNQAITYGRN
ncbi:bifunctional sugar phosphate isomerase/epimerase/4-hydroxyphenylpyruvate dioxygenase family protein [Rothia nasimurium]|uniref:bifunctional sugar phosphate isomerase/epimerase/4-hydroxyphenylpyruvate dioxygenase family protein n=1 Tax=Rothia nasimurium TaxID=85336 RepID=UPI003B9F1883